MHKHPVNLFCFASKQEGRAHSASKYILQVLFRSRSGSCGSGIVDALVDEGPGSDSLHCFHVFLFHADFFGCFCQ